MPITVFQAASIVDGELVMEPRSRCALGDLVGFLARLPSHPRAGGPIWTIVVRDPDGSKVKAIPVRIESGLSAAEYHDSLEEPVCLWSVESASDIDTSGLEQQFWLFRDDIYATERRPRRSEREEIVLRIKALHFQANEALNRLREQVANFGAIESLSTGRANRQPIPDDVKLLVWARDGGACVKCGAKRDLQFDHIIPFSRGGGDQAENIQLLCRSCNLAKKARLL